MPFQHAFIGLLRSAYSDARYGVRTGISRSPSSRRLSSLGFRCTTRNPSIGLQSTRTRTEKLPRTQIKTFATVGARNSQREIAILGGGITGLTAAHYLSRHAKNAHITLYEGSQRLGGWIHGENLRVGSGENDKVLFHRGPRILRPNNRSVRYDEVILYDVLHTLDIMDSIHLDKQDKSRYIYYPDHLVRLPSSEISVDNVLSAISSYFNEPIWNGALLSLYRALHSEYGREPGDYGPIWSQDESIGAYFDRMFGDDRITKNILSAIIHGIYGGDVYELSAKHSIFSSTWLTSKYPIRVDSEQVPMRSKDLILLRDMVNNREHIHIDMMLHTAKRTSSMNFDDGLITLVKALVQDLRAQKNVTIKTGHRVASLAYENKKISVRTKDKSSKQYEQVISTLFSKHLASLVRPSGALPSLEDTHAVTMMVINMWFPNPHILDNYHGFGYLIPSTTPNNEECLLGVLFDSDLQSKPDAIPGTKLTAMMGGHYWDDWPKLPTEEMAEAMAKEAVFRHLRIDPSEPVFTSAKLCRDCLPQHAVGHTQRMASAHYELMEAFDGRLSVAGPSYTGVGVLPAMRGGFDIAMAVAYGHGPPWFSGRFGPATFDDMPTVQVDHVGMTGLLSFTVDDYCNYILYPNAGMPGKNWQTKSAFQDISLEEHEKFINDYREKRMKKGP